MNQHIDSLESRIVCSGTVSITSTGERIIFQGDAFANTLSISQVISEDGTPSGGFQVIGYDDTELIVDGVSYNNVFGTSRFDTTSAFFRKDWDIQMGDGNDEVFTNLYAKSTTYIDLGNGNDRLRMTSTPTDTTCYIGIKCGAGDDRVTFGSVHGSLTIIGGAGRDFFSAVGDLNLLPMDGRFNIRGTMQLIDTQGRTSINLRGVDVRLGVQIITGNSIDRITLDHCSFKRQVLIATHRGSDVLTSISSRFRFGGVLATGSGDDVIDGFGDLIIF